jgi:TnpA family transposase
VDPGLVFAVSHLLGFSYAPRFKNLPRRRLYIFRNRKGVERSAWKIKPAGYADDEIMIQQWDEILRMIATIKLKEVTASDLFRRLNSCSKQHALYRALKAFGQIPKSLFILQVIDDPVLRQAIEEQWIGSSMCTASRGPSRWATRGALSRRGDPRLDGCLAAPQPAR